jgi:nucleoid-associated protein YgaU
MNFLHMDTDVTGQVMDTIETAGREFGEAWNGIKARIITAEAGIGTGLLAQAFLPKYQPRQVAETADKLSGAFLAKAGAGRQAIEDYLNADAVAAQKLGQVAAPVGAGAPPPQPLPTGADAPPPQPVPVYRVEQGDRLGNIADRSLGEFNRYPDLARLNEVRDPDGIHPGQLLNLPAEAVDRGVRPHAAGQLAVPPAAEEPPGAGRPAGPGPTEPSAG